MPADTDLGVLGPDAHEVTGLTAVVQAKPSAFSAPTSRARITWAAPAETFIASSPLLVEAIGVTERLTLGAAVVVREQPARLYFRPLKRYLPYSATSSGNTISV